MTGLSIFEDFSNARAAQPRSAGTAASPAGDPLEGYESGYKAGWDDASKAHQDSSTHLSSVLTRNLEQIDFTLVEAQALVLENLRPVLEEIMRTLLPALSPAAITQIIAEELAPLLKEHSPSEFTLTVSSADEAGLSAFLNASSTLSRIPVVAKDTIGEGQVYIGCPPGQRKIDIGAAIAEMQNRVSDFLENPQLEQANAK